MTTILVQLTALTIVLMASQPRASRAQGSIGSWLDEPELASWNTPGRVIPMAPPIEGGTDRAAGKRRAHRKRRKTRK